MDQWTDTADPLQLWHTYLGWPSASANDPFFAEAAVVAGPGEDDVGVCTLSGDALIRSSAPYKCPCASLDSVACSAREGASDCDLVEPLGRREAAVSSGVRVGTGPHGDPLAVSDGLGLDPSH